jgi:hypothetical protein
VAKADLLSKLFVGDFDLLIDHLPREPVDGHVDPVVPLAFNNEIVCHDTNVLAPFSCWLTSMGQLLLQVACQARPPDTPCRQAGRGYHRCEQDRDPARCEASSASRLRR